MLDEMFYDDSYGCWMVMLHDIERGYSKEIQAELAEGVPEPDDRKGTYACDAELDEVNEVAIIKAVGELIAHDEG